MKKAYIIPEIQIYDADAENLLTGSPDNDPEVVGDEFTPGYGGSDGNAEDVGSLAKQGDFFCDNFEYDLDF